MDSTKRFSDRVGDYVKYRPGYPAAILEKLQEVYAFGSDWAVADIGSGTGISTELFLRNGNRVYAVEPNEAMRKKAEELLGQYADFVSVDGTAEATQLQAGSINLLVAGQAFHWFDPARARQEFVRIAKSGACVALIWNERLMEKPFEREYEELILRYAGDYKTINHKNITDEQIGAFFHPLRYELYQWENSQDLDFEGLKGRLLSSSYIPKEGQRHEEMIAALEVLFSKYASGGEATGGADRDAVGAGGRVRIRYATKMYGGIIKP